MHRVRITPPIALRTVRSVISGRHWQNERPIAERTEPSGHAVGFHHLQTGIAMLAGARGDGEDIFQGAADLDSDKIAG